jgi:acetyl-CoA acyltransferase
MPASRTDAVGHSLEIMLTVGGHEVAGPDSETMDVGPMPAVRGLWERRGREAPDDGLVELTGAFASETLYCKDEFGFRDDVFTINGGGRLRVSTGGLWCPSASDTDPPTWGSGSGFRR